MRIWLDLITRELVFVALLAAIGSGPAIFLPDRFDRVARWALAPVLGLCVGVCVTVTLVYAFPTRDTGWVVIALAVASVALAWRRTGRHARWRRSPDGYRAAAERPFPARQSSAIVRDGLQVAVVVIVILVSFNYPLALRHTVGPDGGYSIADTTGYVSETNGEERDSIHKAEHLHPPLADLATFYWAGYAHNYQQLDVSALESNVNVLLGVGSTDTDSPFLIAVLLVGALGAFAVVRGAVRRPTWAASLAGCLFAGPLFVEMFMDGSQGAIVGSAVLAPVVALGYEALRHRRTATLVLFALLVAGLQTVYPLFLPPVVIGGLAAIGFLVVRRLLRGWPSLDEVGLAIGQLAGVVALAALFTPVAFERNLRYWIGLLNGSFSLSGLPAYVLPFNVIAGLAATDPRVLRPGQSFVCLDRPVHPGRARACADRWGDRAGRGAPPHRRADAGGRQRRRPARLLHRGPIATAVTASSATRYRLRRSRFPHSGSGSRPWPASVGLRAWSHLWSLEP